MQRLYSATRNRQGELQRREDAHQLGIKHALNKLQAASRALHGSLPIPVETKRNTESKVDFRKETTCTQTTQRQSQAKQFW